MPDESTRLSREETNRRKFIRRCIESPKEPEFFSVVREALYAAAPVDVLDQERILDSADSLFERHMYEFAGIRKRPAYIAWCVEWISRIARLTALAKSLLPSIEKQCGVHPEVVGPAILYNVDKYDGPEESGPLLEWATAWATKAEQHTIMFLGWYENPACQAAVRAGVWDVLRACGNLGGTTYKCGDWHPDFVRSLCSDAWRGIMLSMDELAEPSDEPIEARLFGKARNPVLEYKSSSLRHRKKHISDDTYIRLADAQQLADEDEFTLSILKYAKGVPESDEDKERRLESERKAGAGTGERRHCVKCNAVLATWNQSEQSICIPCWQSSQPDYYVPAVRHRIGLRSNRVRAGDIPAPLPKLGQERNASVQQYGLSFGQSEHPSLVQSRAMRSKH